MGHFQVNGSLKIGHFQVIPQLGSLKMGHFQVNGSLKMGQFQVSLDLLRSDISR